MIADPKEGAPEPLAGGLRVAVVRGASGTALAYFLSQVLLLIVYGVLARLTTPAVFGTFAAGSIFIGFGGIFTHAGMTAALVQRRDRVAAAASTVLASMLVTGLLLALLSLALSPLVGLYFQNGDVALVAAALSGQFAITGFVDVPFTLLRRRLAVRPSLFIDPLAVCALGATSAVGLIGGLGVWALVIGSYASLLTNIVGYWIAARWKPDLSLMSWGLWRELASYARHIVASEVLREAMSVANTAVVGRFLGPTSLAQFRFAWRLSTQVTSPILAAYAYTIQPALVRLADDPTRTRTVVRSALRLLSVISFPIGALFIPLGEPITLVLFGAEWRHAGRILMALSGMVIALPMISLASEVLKARGRPDVLPRMQGLWAFLSIGLMIAFVPLGAVGIAAAASLAAIAAATYALARMPAVVDVPFGEVVRAIFPALTSSALMAGLLLALNRYVLRFHPQADLATLGHLLFELGLGIGLYLAFIALLWRSALKELAQALALMPGLRRSGRR
jgi:PST family polysaccharide transporter